MQDDREGIFDTIIRNKSHYQKRAYQCIKCLVNLFSNCAIAHNLLKSTPEFKSKWETAIAWLQEELDRRPFGTTGNQYNWSPPAPSNDSSNGYYLERSQSARITLTKAARLIPPDEKTDDVEEVAQDEADSPAGSSSLSSSQSQVTVFEDISKDHSRPEADQRPAEFSRSIDSSDRSGNRRIAETYRRRSNRRMALTRPDMKPDLCDSLTNDVTEKLNLTAGQIRAPSPIPPVSEWPSSSSSSGVKWQSDGQRKLTGISSTDKSLFLKSGSRDSDDVVECDEINDK
jgi:hypothetical protein